MGKWDHREQGRIISKAVIKEKQTDDLIEAHKFIKKFLDLRKSSKLAKTYIEGTKSAIAKNGEPKVFVEYRFDGTATGRLSCAAYKAGRKKKDSMGVSFHTLPRDKENNIRSLYNAPPGYAFITIDYAAMELRVLAHIAKEGNMQLAFMEGKDLHTYTAQMLFNKQEITPEERQIAKAVSFLIVYGGGAFNLAETTGISFKQAEKIIKNYRKVYPGIFSYMEFVERFIKDNKYAYTIFGRRRHLPNIDSKDFGVVARASRQGLNFTIQSTASDILLCGMLGTSRRLKEEGLDSRCVATVHDSIEIISRLDCIERTLEIAYDELVNYPFVKDHFNIHFNAPFKIDAEVGFSFGDGKNVKFSPNGEVENMNEIMEYMTA